jgi:hypothetical protein
MGWDGMVALQEQTNQRSTQQATILLAFRLTTKMIALIADWFSFVGLVTRGLFQTQGKHGRPRRPSACSCSVASAPHLG